MTLQAFIHRRRGDYSVHCRNNAQHEGMSIGVLKETEHLILMHNRLVITINTVRFSTVHTCTNQFPYMFNTWPNVLLGFHSHNQDSYHLIKVLFTLTKSKAIANWKSSQTVYFCAMSSLYLMSIKHTKKTTKGMFTRNEIQPEIIFCIKIEFQAKWMTNPFAPMIFYSPIQNNRAAEFRHHNQIASSVWMRSLVLPWSE